MIRYLIDTDISVDHIRGRKYLPSEIISESAISIINLAELLYGAYKSLNPKKNLHNIDELLGLGIEIKNINIEVVDVYAQLKADLERTGQRLDEFDLLIGACAKANALTLVTRNIKHFKRIKGLKLYKGEDL